MRRKRSDRVRIWKNRSLFHPRAATLLAFHDCELGSSDTREVAYHLETCKKCTLELDRLQEDFRKFLDVTAAPDSQFPSVEEGWKRLRSAIEEWQAGKSLPSSSHAATAGAQSAKLRVSQELEVYLGSRATSALIKAKTDRGIAEGTEGVVRAADVLLSAFLGKETTSRINTRLQQIGGLDRSDFRSARLA